MAFLFENGVYENCVYLTMFYYFIEPKSEFLMMEFYLFATFNYYQHLYCTNISQNLREEKSCEKEYFLWLVLYQCAKHETESLTLKKTMKFGDSTDPLILLLSRLCVSMIIYMIIYY